MCVSEGEREERGGREKEGLGGGGDWDTTLLAVRRVPVHPGCTARVSDLKHVTPRTKQVQSHT